MKRHAREAIEIVRATVEPWGMRCTVQDGGKHLAVVVTVPDGRWHKFTISGSPRDPDAQLNMIRQQVRAWIDTLGDMSSGRGIHGQRKPRRHTRVRSHIWRVEVAIDPTDGPARDPWVALSGFRVNR